MHDESNQISLDIGNDVALAARGFLACVKAPWATTFLGFHKRMMTGAKRRPIFLIVDRGPAHIAKKTRAFVESLNGGLRQFYHRPYSPDRNPDELV
jgi:hypothetical protein